MRRHVQVCHGVAGDNANFLLILLPYMGRTHFSIVSTSPCYPNYAIRNLYIPNGFDYLILVEDELAKLIVDKIIKEETLGESRLICVLPSGGWSQTLKLHYDIINYNALGKGRKIVSIFFFFLIEIVT